MKIYVLQIFICLIMILCGFLVGKSCSDTHYRCSSEMTVKTDTLTLRDTIREPFPLLVDVRITEDAIEAPLADIVIREDSLVVLPVEVKTYEGEDYKAQVSGYKPKLDWIEVFPEVKYITKETVPRSAPKHWGLGIQTGIGVGVAGGRLQGIPYIGFGISYNIIQW